MGMKQRYCDNCQKKKRFDHDRVDRTKWLYLGNIQGTTRTIYICATCRDRNLTGNEDEKERGELLAKLIAKLETRERRGYEKRLGASIPK